MLVEHVFVTTKEAPEALAAAREFLEMGGFVLRAESANQVELTRGSQTPAKAKGIVNLPQQVSVDFDRGRVNVAVLIRERRRAGDLHKNLLLGIAIGIEHRLTDNSDELEARSAWIMAEAAIAADLARRRRNNIYLVIFVCVILAGCSGFWGFVLTR